MANEAPSDTFKSWLRRVFGEAAAESDNGSPAVPEMTVDAGNPGKTNMNILVLSDSHSHQDFMQRCMEHFQPDAVIHLGDYVRDGRELMQHYPGIPMYQVPGNCDYYSGDYDLQPTITVRLAGVLLMLTHGHKQGVKEGTDRLLAEARKLRVDAVLYGHTHIAECYREDDGLWVLNPGTAGFFRSTAGWLVLRDGKIQVCKLLSEADLGEK